LGTWQYAQRRLQRSVSVRVRERRGDLIVECASVCKMRRPAPACNRTGSNWTLFSKGWMSWSQSPTASDVQSSTECRQVLLGESVFGRSIFIGTAWLRSAIGKTAVRFDRAARRVPRPAEFRRGAFVRLRKTNALPLSIRAPTATVQRRAGAARQGLRAAITPRTVVVVARERQSAIAVTMVVVIVAAAESRQAAERQKTHERSRATTCRVQACTPLSRNGFGIPSRIGWRRERC
jgi:hypothetical protein